MTMTKQINDILFAFGPIKCERCTRTVDAKMYVIILDDGDWPPIHSCIPCLTKQEFKELYDIYKEQTMTKSGVFQLNYRMGVEAVYEACRKNRCDENV